MTNKQPRPGTKKANPKVAARGKYETIKDRYKRRKQELQKPKKNKGKAKEKKQSLVCSKTMKIMQPKAYRAAEARAAADNKPHMKIRYPEPSVTLDRLRELAVEACSKSKGMLADPITARQAPIDMLMRNYRALSNENPKYIDHYYLVFRIYKKQLDKDTAAALRSATP